MPETAQTTKKKKKRRKKRPFLVLLILIILLIGSAVFLSSNFFNVTNFEISGNVHYSESQIKAISGLVTGKNLLFETKLKEGRDNLLSTSYIKIAEMSRKLPNTVVIEIVERDEYAAVPFGDEFIIIDEEGLVLRSSTVDEALPILDCLTVISRADGDPLEVEQGSLLNYGLKLIQAAKDIDFYFERIKLDSVNTKAYIYYNHYYCQGTNANILENMSKIKSMVAEQYQQNIQRGCIIVGSNGYLSFTPQIE